MRVTAPMLALFLAALTLPSTPAAQPTDRARFLASSAVAQAEVRIRIVSGARVTLGQREKGSVAQFRSAEVVVDGERRAARLIEFP